MQKPVQDIYTAAIFAALLSLVTVTVVMANTVLQQSGISQSGMARASTKNGDTDVPVAGLALYGSGSFSNCEVIYHLASQDSGALTAVSDEGQEEDAVAFHYAVYTCIERSPTIDDYI